MSRTASAQLVAGMAALVLVSLLVVRMSDAAFSATTVNPDNSWTAGTVALTDSQAGTAMFEATGMVPGGDPVTNCVEVTYSGSVATSATALYASWSDSDGGGATAGTPAAGLSDDLVVTVQMGEPGVACADLGAGNSTEVHAGTLDSMDTDFASGSLGWTPAGGSDTVRAFAFTVELPDTTPNDAQGDGATATFTWEARS